QGQAKLDINSQTVTLQQLVQAGVPPVVAGQIIQRRGTNPFTDIGQVFGLNGATTDSAKSILDACSVGGAQSVEGKLDLNTVTQTVLNTLPNITPDLVSSIINQQSTGFTTLGDFASVPGITLEDLQNFSQYFTVNTQNFIVRVEGRAGPTRVAYEAL